MNQTLLDRIEASLHDMPLNELELLYKQAKELEKRNSENLYSKYIPNGKCEEFIKLVGNNQCFVNLFCAANGVGKSCLAVNILVNICFDTQNEWFDYPLFKQFPYTKRGRIISDPTTIKSVLLPEIKKWFPSNRYTEKWETSKEGKQYDCRIVTDTGFEIDLLTNEQNPKEFESTTLGFCWIDEPLSRPIFHATVARMRTGGIIFWTLTPLFSSAWIKDDLYDKRDGKNVDYVTADVEANCKEHGIRGILHHENIEKMISQYPEHEKEARIKGKFGHLIGLVHKLFEPKIHVIEPFDINRDNATVYMALDTHPRVNDACLWMAVNDKQQKFIVSELSFKGTDIELAERIKTREMNWYVGDRLIDPSGMIQDMRSSEMSFADRLAGHGLRFRGGSKDLINCIRRTDEAMKYEMRGEVLIRQPELYIFSNCINLISELQHYVWDEFKGKGADEKDPKPRPKDKDDHFVECLHRLLIENYRYTPTIAHKRFEPLKLKRFKNFKK